LAYIREHDADIAFNTVLTMPISVALSNAQAQFNVVELRQYTLHSGRRDELIGLFESALLEPQEAAGMVVLGQFVDLDDPNRFVWLRGFADMTSRTRALTAFYGGVVWKAHRSAANATMVDSDNVLLLRPAPGCAPPMIESWSRRPAFGEEALLAAICLLDRPGDACLARTFVSALASSLALANGALAGCYVTEQSVNTFTRLPVRQGEHVLVWVARFDQVKDAANFASKLAQSLFEFDATGKGSGTHERPTARILQPPLVLRLAPTSSSRF
jgi:hypothetical protein